MNLHPRRLFLALLLGLALYPGSAAAQTSGPAYDVSPWQSGAVDTVGGVSPYVVVLANELAQSARGACQPATLCAVQAVYRAHIAAHVGLDGAEPMVGLTVAQLLSVPEPASEQLQAAAAQLQAAGLPIDTSSFWR
jgi:hypothetical protein